MDPAAPLLMLWAPSRSTFSHPKRLAALLSLSARAEPVSPGINCPPARPRRRMLSQNDDVGQNSYGACISSDPTGYFSQIHFLTILGPPALCYLLRNFIAMRPPNLPIAAGASRAESSPIFRGQQPERGVKTSSLLIPPVHVRRAPGFYSISL